MLPSDGEKVFDSHVADINTQSTFISETKVPPIICDIILYQQLIVSWVVVFGCGVFVYLVFWFVCFLLGQNTPQLIVKDIWYSIKYVTEIHEVP